MEVGRLRLDPFAFALGALTLLTFSFLAARNGAAVIMSGLCFGALLVARLAGFSNRALVPAAAGLVVLLWLVWTHPLPISSRENSALAHGSGGVLIGWAMAEHLRVRIAWPVWAIGAIGAVFGLTILWELGEFLGDRAFETALVPSKRDSAVDICFGTLGGSVGALLATVVAVWRGESQ